MAYTNTTLVEGILDDDPTIDLTPFIDAAHNLVVNVCVPECYSDETLTQIETWLAAHFYCIRRPRTNEEEADSIRDRFDSKVDLGLKVTRYGQMALMLDYKGALARYNFANMGSGVPKVTAKWLGRRARRSPPYGYPYGYPY